MIRVEPINPSDAELFYQAAKLHINSIHHGILPLLGECFLARLYRLIAIAPNSGVWAIVINGKLRGFLAGCANVRITYRWILLNHILGLAWAGRSSFFKVGVLSKLYYIVSYPIRRQSNDRKQHPGIDAEVLAIAVEQIEHGKGYGRALLAEFEEALRYWGVNDYRVLTNITDSSSNAFYLSTGFEAQGSIRHHSLTLRIYQKAIN